MDHIHRSSIIDQPRTMGRWRKLLVEISASPPVIRITIRAHLIVQPYSTSGPGAKPHNDPSHGPWGEKRRTSHLVTVLATRNVVSSTCHFGLLEDQRIIGLRFDSHLSQSSLFSRPLARAKPKVRPISRTPPLPLTAFFDSLRKGRTLSNDSPQKSIQSSCKGGKITIRSFQCNRLSHLFLSLTRLVVGIPLMTVSLPSVFVSRYLC